MAALALLVPAVSVLTSTVVPSHASAATRPTAPRAVSSADDWTQLRYGAGRDAHAVGESTIGTSNVGSLHQRWSTVLGTESGTGTALSSVSVSNGTVYAEAPISNQTTGTLAALNIASGVIRWKVTTPDRTSGAPAVAGSVVIVLGYDDNSLTAYSTATGHRLWRQAVGGDGASGGPAVSGSLVYNSFSGRSGVVIQARNITNGVLAWSQPVPDAFALVASPVVDHGQVMVNDDGGVSAWNATTGTPLWTHASSAFEPFDSIAAAANDLLYVPGGTDVCTLNALRETDGSTAWATPLFHAPGSACFLVSSVAAANGDVFAETTDGNLFSLNGTTGRVIWETSTPDAAFGEPTTANGVVYIGGDTAMHAYTQLTGAPLTLNTGTTTTAYEVVIAEGTIAVFDPADFAVHVFSP